MFVRRPGKSYIDVAKFSFPGFLMDQKMCYKALKAGKYCYSLNEYFKIVSINVDFLKCLQYNITIRIVG